MIRAAGLTMAAAGLIGCAEPGALADSQGASEPASIEIGARLIRANQPEMAVDVFSRVITEKGVSAAALTGLGVAYHRMGRPGQATQLFESAVEVDPNQPVARNNLGVVLYNDGAFAAALSEFERAYALTGGRDERVNTNLGIAIFSLSQVETTAEVDEVEFDVIQYGHGVYRLEPRKPDATVAPKTAAQSEETQS